MVGWKGLCGGIGAFVAIVSFATANAASDRWSAIDGDTILRTTVERRTLSTEKIRLHDVDAPELHGACEAERVQAVAARDLVADRLAAAAVIEVQSIPRRDKFGRTLAVVLVDGVSLSEILLQAGLARPYHGEKRKSWCESP